MLNNNYLYMAVTPDEYELPLAVEDSVTKLAKLFNVKPSKVSTLISMGRSGKTTGVKFLRIKVNNDD